MRGVGAVWSRRFSILLFALGLVARAGLGYAQDARFPVSPGPLGSQKLVDEILEQDRKLFDIVFNRCDADALAAMLTEDFEFFHDKHGRIASPRQFTDDIRQGCEGQARGTNVRARRELVAGSSVVYPMNNYGAIQTGTHRFYGLEPGKPDALRESAKFFHVWKQVDGGWKLARSFSFDHHPAPASEERKR
jgi:ketosteroid isomerase-like protein